MIQTTDVTVIVDDVTLLPPTSIDVTAGSWHVLRGPNGAGKSTLLAVIAGRMRPSGGEVLVDGSMPDSRSKRFRTTLGSLLNAPIVARDLTVREHLTLIATSWADPDPGSRADQELDRWGIGSLGLRFTHELSSGQRQLFALATAFIRPARVLLLDEPEQRLDADRRGILIDAVKDRQAAGDTVLMATHADDVAAAADEVTWLATSV